MLVSGHAEGFICGGFDMIVPDISASSSIHFFCKVGEPTLTIMLVFLRSVVCVAVQAYCITTWHGVPIVLSILCTICIL